MSLPAVSVVSFGQPDPGNTCTPSLIAAKRSLSVPLKRQRAFSSPGRLCRCASLSSQARQAFAAASVVAQPRTEQQNAVCTSLLSADDQLSQLEASYQAQSAAELEGSEGQPSTSDCIEGDFVQLERSWQAQAEASTSGRSSDANSSIPYASRPYQRHANSRSTRRSSRLYAASTRRNQSQSHGVEEVQAQPSGCPDSQYCAVIRGRLQIEKHKRRVSRSECKITLMASTSAFLQVPT